MSAHIPSREILVTWLYFWNMMEGEYRGGICWLAWTLESMAASRYMYAVRSLAFRQKLFLCGYFLI